VLKNNEISPNEAGLLLDKILGESIPVVAFFIRDSVQVKIRGFVESVTSGAGLVVVAKQDSVPVGYLRVPIGLPVGRGCSFAYGDKRELPEETREESAKLGEAVLIIYTPDRGELRLLFTP
jgi:hypothetical protein